MHSSKQILNISCLIVTMIYVFYHNAQNEIKNMKKKMADRIGTMRVSLRSQLEEGQQDRSWAHITKQIGMFAFSGLTKEEVTALRDKHHIYCTLDGRISMAGITSQNVSYMADSIKDVISK